MRNNSSDYFLRYESQIGRITIITQTLHRIRLCFRMKVRFSDAFLVSHSYNAKTKSAKIYMLLILTRDGAFKFSPLPLMSCYVIHFSVYLSQREVERTDLAFHTYSAREPIKTADLQHRLKTNQLHFKTRPPP